MGAILRKNNLGKRKIRTDETKREKIAEFVSRNKSLSYEQITKQFNVSESVVRRVCKKYKIEKLDTHKYRVSQNKINKDDNIRDQLLDKIEM